MTVLYLAHEGHSHGLDPGLTALLVAATVLVLVLLASALAHRLRR